MVVDQVQDAGVNASQHVAEEVAQWVDGPAEGDDEAHGVEGRLHVPPTAIWPASPKKISDEVQDAGVNASQHVAEEVAQGVDGPAGG